MHVCLYSYILLDFLCPFPHPLCFYLFFLTPCLLKMFILASCMPWCWHLCPCQAIELAAADKPWHIRYPVPQWLPSPGQAPGSRTEYAVKEQHRDYVLVALYLLFLILFLMLGILHSVQFYNLIPS